jgi:hypothetical protein
MPESKLTKKVELVNKKLEKLKRDEESLYKALKEKYPNLSDDDLRKKFTHIYNLPLRRVFFLIYTSNRYKFK